MLPLAAATDDASGATRFAEWTAQRALPGSQAEDDHLIADFEALAACDPVRALALARAETKQRLRWEMFRALLRGWARKDTDAAAAWAMQQPYLDRTIAVDAVLAGIIDDPSRAIALEKNLVARSPGDVAFFGNALLSLLAKNGDFAIAADFAQAAPAEVRSDWLTMTYQLWAAQRPADARSAVEGLADPAQRAALLPAVIDGWAQADPSALADYAATTLTGQDRVQGCTAALRAWAALDVTAAAEWVSRQEATPELDAAIGALATTPQLLQHPDTAIAWARAVADPAKRAVVLSDVFHEWSQTDPAGARRGVEQSADLTDQQRADLLAGLPRG